MLELEYKTTEQASEIFLLGKACFLRKCRKFAIIPSHRSKTGYVWNSNDLKRLAHCLQEEGLQKTTVGTTISEMIDEYIASTRFQAIAPATKRTYKYDLEIFRKAHGHRVLTGFTRFQAVKFYESMKDKPRSAFHVIKCARLVFNYAKDMGLITINPFERMRVKTNPPRDIFWTEEEVLTFIKTAIAMNRYSIGLAVRLGADTGQRTADIRTLRRENISGKTIKLKQGKTGAFIKVPLLARSQSLLSHRPFPDSEYIITNEETGTLYEDSIFSKWFARVRKQAGLRRELQFKDLRTTAVFNLTLAGNTVQEVAAVTGHKVDSCQKIIDTYLPRHEKVAAHAINNLESYLSQKEDDNSGT